ncbi:hypothetical protein [Clostridium argentinense]|uniref:hypothetical protein n=1 Tax=Clostridium argentinense TaxID=29341 RepID=UPI0011AB8225|nr:hypothetical protein [Clostridium argentinense]NFF39115.1 hypothetical protein [Clostridium argentinense]NFP49527.1 hypothetical protein [Clostridium argentinense]NFP72230.1 hypothetical protein [Clostridium argentinense]NFP76401.1 hypothetical protein [Clostridium argentinense]
MKGSKKFDYLKYQQVPLAFVIIIHLMMNQRQLKSQKKNHRKKRKRNRKKRKKKRKSLVGEN